MRALVTTPILAAVLLTALPVSAQNWTTPALGTTEDILAMEQASFSNVWLVGRNGLVAESNLDRTAWTIESVGTSADLHGVARQSSVQVWAAGAGGTVRVRPFDSWFQRDIGGTSERFVLYSRTSGAAHAVGSGGSIYLSTDAGENWTPQSSGTTASLNHGAGFQSSASWIVGDGGTILHTTDGGDTWTPQNSGTTANLNYILQQGSWLIVAGDAGTILRSNDGGATWLQETTNVSANLNAMAPSAFDAADFMACGDDGTLLRTSDYGVTWCRIDTETSTDLNAVRWLGFTEVVIAGDGGFLRRSTNTGGECITPTSVGSTSGPSAFALRGPHPQPVRGVSTVSLSVARGQVVRAAVFDLRGRLVSVLRDGVVDAGARVELRVDARDWPAGAYFLRVSGEDFTETRKMLVLE